VFGTFGEIKAFTCTPRTEYVRVVGGIEPSFLTSEIEIHVWPRCSHVLIVLESTVFTGGTTVSLDTAVRRSYSPSPLPPTPPHPPGWNSDLGPKARKLLSVDQPSGSVELVDALLIMLCSVCSFVVCIDFRYSWLFMLVSTRPDRTLILYDR
jgi:hypothetical protein